MQYDYYGADLAMRMVEHSVDQVVGVVPMRDRRMSAICPVRMPTFAGGRRTAGFRVRGADLDLALVDVPFVIVMHVTIMEVVHMPAVTDRHMTAIGAVGVAVTFVGRVRHLDLLSVLSSIIQDSMNC